MVGFVMVASRAVGLAARDGGRAYMSTAPNTRDTPIQSQHKLQFVVSSQKKNESTPTLLKTIHPQKKTQKKRTCALSS